ncbi:TIGR03752 family integrating conjugative element protein [Vibrio barjaei]|uniref:TIGR03752 family integrating conjugative element protein n=1 Tax=Vibrio barjaei TaxID=1676683 RepID=UPI0022838362|nr:TIGR03752 family integrating conjugative element protein [Vibrio barjaei]MCY9874549.1 TIGR03752 family integrating conjugative element protein [Vibrio barjaei]
MSKPLLIGSCVVITALGGVMLLGGDEPVSAYQNDTSNPFEGEEISSNATSDYTLETLRTLIAKDKERERQLNDLIAQLKKQRAEGVEAYDPRVAELQARLDQSEKELEKISEEVSSDNYTKLNIKNNYLDQKPKNSSDSVDSGRTDLNVVDDIVGGVEDIIPKLLLPGMKQSSDKKSGSVNLPSNKAPENGGRKTSVDVSTGEVMEQSGAIVWVEPGDLVETVDKEGNVTRTFPVDFTARESESELINAVGDEEEEELISVYSVPAGSTLIDSVSMTALLGRVPKSGTVVSPYRFKIYVGQENLATNGHYIPNLKGMVLSGEAVGDYTMSCVSGQIDKATYTFNDGTVRVIAGESIGYISDEYGVPCIRGDYLTNAPEYIARKGGMAVLGAFGEALGDGEVTKLSSGESVTSVVTGDSLTYGAGKGVSEAVKETSSWFDELQASAFDAVFAPVGTSVNVHIERTLEIDYEVQGRKLNHGSVEYM